MSLRCFTAEDATLYERGYPHLVKIVEDPAKLVPLAKLFANYWGAHQVEWPRSTARAFVRAGVIGKQINLDAPDARAAATRTDDIGRAEAQALIRTMLARQQRVSFNQYHPWLFCLEALVGTDATLDLLATEIAALPMSRVGVDAKQLGQHGVPYAIDDSGPSLLAYGAGYLLLRASPSAAQAARAKLESVWTQTVANNASLDEYSLRAGLDLALHGMDGARRILPTSHWQYLDWWGFVDDTAMLRERLLHKMKADFHPDPRVAWNGGEEILTILCSTKIVRSTGKRRASFFEQIGKFDHPSVAAMMAEWAADKGAGPYATWWLATHKNTDDTNSDCEAGER